MTGTWRDTLFVWQGYVEPNSNNANILTWKGSWVGCEECPDARAAPTPHQFAFRLSTMKFHVSTKGAATKKGGFWYYDMTGGSGWDLGEGDNKARHKDETHVILSRENLAQKLELSNLDDNAKKFLVVAKGENAFGFFISAGYLENVGDSVSSRTMLTLGRRYLDHGDIRAKWTMEELYQKIATVDRGFMTLSVRCTDIKIRIAPWRTLDLHAQKIASSKAAKGKRKRDNNDDADDGDNNELPSLNIPQPPKGFNPMLRLNVKESEIFGVSFHLVSCVRWLAQCNGCGRELPPGQDKKVICNAIEIWKKDFEGQAEPHQDVDSMLYCSADCVKEHGAKAWAEASKVWRDHDATNGFLLQASVDEEFCKIVESDKKLDKIFTDIGWGADGEWWLDGAGPPDDYECEADSVDAYEDDFVDDD